MATAGARYEERTGNIWSYAHRGDMTGLKAALGRGVDVNMPNTVGWTPAHAAAAGGRTKALRLLAKSGADLELADRGGDLPAHQAAKNGHVHALQALQELGADIAKVRLSQAKGKAVRDKLTKAYRKAGRRTNGGDDDDGEDGAESEKEVSVVGYARKQAKSTAFWGPRRQPISAKIKKKITKEKRLKKKEKMERRWGNAEEDATGSSNDSQEGVSPEVEEAEDEITNQQEVSYIETVRNIKRNKKHRRRQQQMRRQQQQKIEQPSSDEEDIEKELRSDSDSSSSSEDKEEVNDVSRSGMNGFAALSLMDSSDGESD